MTRHSTTTCPLWPAGHLPHKGGEDLPQTSASIEPQRSGWVKPSPLWGGWGGVFFSEIGGTL
ncbi:hypothetical protein EDF70_101672 [Neorhizobium sp. JUb45]|nr:hypothetical protein EDF70_101672 [Neorhizobium sp. JUb45]